LLFILHPPTFLHTHLLLPIMPRSPVRSSSCLSNPSHLPPPDRFIPYRPNKNLGVHWHLPTATRLLSFCTGQLQRVTDPFDSLATRPVARYRRVPDRAVLTLDAPGLRDDFYTESLDWNRNHVIAVALDGSIVMCNILSRARTTTTIDVASEIFAIAWQTSTSTLSSSSTALSASPIIAASYECTRASRGLGRRRSRSRHMPLQQQGVIDLFDAEHQALLYRIAMRHSQNDAQWSTSVARSLAWSPSNPSLLASGDVDGAVQLFDIRTRAARVASTLLDRQRSSMVSGVRWNNCGSYLASGHDDRVLVHDFRRSLGTTTTATRRSSSSSSSFSNSNQHTTTVVHQIDASTCSKALAWSPQCSSLLASGSGRGDGLLRLHNVSAATVSLVSSQRTRSQISCLEFSPDGRELVSGHGDPNELVLWSVSSDSELIRRAALSMPARVLGSALSPDRTSVAAYVSRSLCVCAKHSVV
jgi:cell division cycle 20, cofactor of APC complex